MSKHTDTTRSGDLVERLRDLAGKFEGQGGKHYTAELFGECADRIAALEAKLAEKDAQLAEALAENARLRGALGLIIENESPDTGYGNSSAKIARAALGDWKPEAGDLGGDHVR